MAIEYVYFNLKDSYSPINVYSNHDASSEVERTIMGPQAKIPIALSNFDSDAYGLQKYMKEVDTRRGKKCWLKVWDGGWIKYADIDESGQYSNHTGTLESKQGEEYNYHSGYAHYNTGIITSTQQYYSNGGEEIDNSTTGSLESSEGYYVPLEDITENFGASAMTQAGNASEFYKIESVLGILGLPYQYMPHVDIRIDPDMNYGESAIESAISGTGAVFAEKIIANIPLLMLTPGKPNFMRGYNEEEKKSFISSILGSLNAGNDANLGELGSHTGRFYTFQPTPTEFFNYLNPMARICARLLGIEDFKISVNHTSVSLDNVDWSLYTQQKVKNIVDIATDYMSIPIYLDSDTQIQESFSNDTTDSSLASTINSFSDASRELAFILGYAGSTLDIDGLANSGTLSNSQIMEDLTNRLMNVSKGGIFESLGKTVGAVATGGKLVFPKIWSDSSFSRSYDVNIKLRSPDMDNASLYFNIILPMCFFICLTQPRMMQDNPNAYFSPFLVRASYKGFFNVDMGIISNLSFSKGDEAQWNAMGIPTTVDVSMTITDLYEALSITPTSATNWGFDTLDNTTLMDYLMTMCGINVYKPEIARMLDMWVVNNFSNRARDLFSISLWGNLRQSVSNAVLRIYRSSY